MASYLEPWRLKPRVSYFIRGTPKDHPDAVGEWGPLLAVTHGSLPATASVEGKVF